MAHQPAISFPNSIHFPFNCAGGRTSNVRQKMKLKRPLLFWISLACAVTILSTAMYLMPPADWNLITIGMKKEKVDQIIPRFDQPWGGVKSDFEYEKRFPFMWRLAVGYDPSGVDMIEKELFITWPETRRLWGTIKL